jgi:predicted metal-dependent hydrolase
LITLQRASSTLNRAPSTVNDSPGTLNDSPGTLNDSPGTLKDSPSTLNNSPSALQPEPSVLFVRHPRARRYVLRVADDGTVRVTVPRWGSRREAAAFAAREHAWIDKQRQRIERQHLVRPDLTAAADAIPPPVLRALRDRAVRELPPRLMELAARHGLSVSRVSIRNQRWRWGSCSRNGHICLNWRLVTMPESVRDYVLIHELMHLKQQNHGPRFWALVEAACPGYREAERWLRRSGRTLF